MLFEPFAIKGTKLRNRIVFAPVVTNFGLRNARALNYYVARAKGGAGLVIVHGTPVDLFLGPKGGRGLESLAQAVQAEGAKIAIQLWHGNELRGQAVAPSPRDACREIRREEIPWGPSGVIARSAPER